MVKYLHSQRLSKVVGSGSQDTEHGPISLLPMCCCGKPPVDVDPGRPKLTHVDAICKDARVPRSELHTKMLSREQWKIIVKS